MRIATAGCLALATLFCSKQATAEDLPTHVVRAIRGGSEIEFLGMIEKGSAAELLAVLSANRRATVLHLNSPGGDAAEAHLMADLIHPHHLTTTVDVECDSGCTLVFLSGQQRLIAPGAKLGFHQAWMPGMSAAEINEIDQPERRYMEDLGIPGWFVEKAYSIPSSSVWYPTTTELTDAGVINGVTDRYIIAVGNFRNSTGDDEFAFAQFMEVAKQHDPSGYQALHQHLLKSVTESGLSYSLASDAELMNYILRFVARAEEKPMLAYAQMFGSALSVLAMKDPEACYLLLSGSGTDSQGKAFAGLGSELARKLSYALLRAAANGAENNLPIPSAEAVSAPLKGLSLIMLAKYPQETEAQEHPQSGNHTAYCRYYAHLVDEIMLLPSNTRRDVTRFLMDSSPSESESGSSSGDSTSSPMPSLPLHPHPDK